MLKRVEPLRNELQKLEDDAKDNQQKANEVEQMIRDLEASIARYKEEYAVLISEAQAIKADLAAVEAKVKEKTLNVLLLSLDLFVRAHFRARIFQCSGRSTFKSLLGCEVFGVTQGQSLPFNFTYFTGLL